MKYLALVIWMLGCPSYLFFYDWLNVKYLQIKIKRIPKEELRYLIIWIIGIVLVCTISGCASYSVKMGDAEVKLNYLLQDKHFKSITYNPETHEINVQNFGSETSQVVQAAIETALKGVK